jgi:hypothetical protein
MDSSRGVLVIRENLLTDGAQGLCRSRLPMLILCVRFQPGRLLIRVRSCEAGDCMTDEESEAVVAAFAPSRRRVSSGPCAA